MLKTNLYDVLVDLIDEELKKSKWGLNDKFFKFKMLSIDQRGRVGEHFFRTIFNELNLLESYVDNAHGDWDLEADGFKIEIKTASLDVNNKFQHEGVKSNKLWDVVAFLDINQNDFYVTFIFKDDFEFDIDTYNKKTKKAAKMGRVKLYDKVVNIHYRGKDGTDDRATGAGYKVDFNLKDLKQTKTIKDIENIFNDMKRKHNL